MFEAAGFRMRERGGLAKGMLGKERAVCDRNSEERQMRGNCM